MDDGRVPTEVRTIGLTGGIGTGKSTLAAWLRDSGVALIDTDELARQFVEPGQPALAEIKAAFGRDVVDTDGSLRRGVLADRVFADEEDRNILEGILHPRIHAAWKARVATWRAKGQPLAVVVIPLLFEKSMESEFDSVVGVGCRPSTQWDRLRSRGWSEGEIRRRLEAQLPLAAKMLRATRVIWNDSSLEVMQEQARRIFRAEGCSLS